jgi:para-nitrobenzyl esterase
MWRISVTPGVVALMLLAACARERSMPSSDPTSLRSIAQGELIGFTGTYGSHVWLGIPYAQPPVGELRWREPRPPASWQGRREALAPGEVCPQFPSLVGGVEGDRDQAVGGEDCLTLSVYAPRRDPDALPGAQERWPVMVWIHGGGNSVGAARLYDGGHLAQSQNVVVVLVQYRLGPLGWMHHPSLRAGAQSPDEASGNFGTLDLIRALEWMRDNVAAFGGDPNNVTIFGESAGGHDVYSLLAAKRAAGLFHRAISQSGSVRTAPLAAAENLSDDAEAGSPRSSSEILVRLMQADGTAIDRAQARALMSHMEASDIAGYLRSKSAFDVLRAWQQGSGSGSGGGWPSTVADGSLLPADGILAALRQPDGHNRVPVILGTNRDENRTFQMLDPQFTRIWFGLIYRPRNLDRYVASARTLAGMWKATGADEPAAALASHQDDVYVYRFDWDEQPSIVGIDFSKLLGAGHGMEIPFVFGDGPTGNLARATLSSENAPGRRALSDAMMSYWSEFARSGRPGRGRDGKLPEWSAWSSAEGAPKMMVLDTPAPPASSELAEVGAGPAQAEDGVRMSAETVTRASVLADLAADTALDAQSRCALLRQMLQRGDLSKEQVEPQCPQRVASEGAAR